MVFNRLLKAAVLLLCAVMSCACVADKRVVSLLPDSFIRRISTDGPGVPIVVFNPLSWERTDAVDMDSPFPGESPYVKITDSAGRPYPARTLGDRLYFTARNVPALGYRVFWATRVAKPVPTAIKCTAECIENQYFRVNIDKRRSVITGIYDKLNARQIMPVGGQSALLRVIGAGKPRDVSGDSPAVMMDSGPARGVLVLDSGSERAPMVQELILHEGVARVDIHVTSEWSLPAGPSQTPATLCAGFQTRLGSAKSVNGGIELLEDGKVAPGLKWADISDGTYGVSLLADRVYACDASKGLLTASLRKQGDSDAAWEANYSLYAHKGGSLTSGALEHSFEIACPLVARATSKHKGELPRVYSVLSYDFDNVIGAISLPQPPGASPILRFYETQGQYSSVPVKVGLYGLKLTPAGQSGRPTSDARPIIERSFTFSLAENESTGYLLSWL